MNNQELGVEIRVEGPGFADRFATRATMNEQTTGLDMAMYLGDAVEQISAKVRRSLGLPPITGLPPIPDWSGSDAEGETGEDLDGGLDLGDANEPTETPAPMTVEHRQARKALQRVLSSVEPGRDEIAVDVIMSRVFGALLEFVDTAEPMPEPFDVEGVDGDDKAEPLDPKRAE